MKKNNVTDVSIINPFLASSELQKEHFNKEEVIKEIKNSVHFQFPHWHIMNCDDIEGDFLLIRSMNIREEMSVGSPFSPQTQTVDRRYQVVLLVNVVDEDEGQLREPPDERFNSVVYVRKPRSLFRILSKIDSKEV